MKRKNHSPEQIVRMLRQADMIISPGGPGWNAVLQRAQDAGDPITETATAGDLPRGILCMVAGCLAVYSTVFAAGYYMYGNIPYAVVFTVVAAVAVVFLASIRGKLEMK